MRALTRIRDAWEELHGIHRALLVAAMAVGAAVVLVYALAIRPNPLLGDQAEYDLQGRFFADGMLWWSTAVTGEPHPTAWKAPLYPGWIGVLYTIFGAGATKVAFVQGLVLAPLTVLLTWMLARRWFGVEVAAVAAFVIALFPLSWEFFGLLYSEALAIPLTVAALLLVLDRPPPTTARAVGVGVLVGVLMLIRPTSFFLFAVIATAFIVAAGWRRGIGMTALAIVCAAMTIAPWTIRNAIELDAFVPISIQDAAAYGTFNDEAANDPDYPYAWRANPEDLKAELDRDPPDGEAEFRARLQDRARDYIADHPLSVVEAFFWNGLSRFWDVRRPALTLNETDFDGRSEAVTAVGLGTYYVLLPLAVLGLWRIRDRRELFLPLLALALAISLVFTIQAGTRYRAPIEPVIVALACSNLTLLGRFRSTEGYDAGR